jgi:ribosomal protein S6
MAEMSQAAEASSQAKEYSDEQAVFEVGFHVVATLPEEEVTGVVEKIKAEIQKSGAEIIKETAPQKIALAYTIERPVSGATREKHQSAYFGAIKFATTREAIPALQAALRSMHEILRFLLVETTREEVLAMPRRAVFASDRLEGKTIEKRPGTQERGGEVSDEELDKSIEALVS